MRLLALKQREVAKGLILIAGALDAVRATCSTGTRCRPTAREAVFATWPGPHTWIVPASGRVPRWITGMHDGVAVRVSAHPLVVALCDGVRRAAGVDQRQPAGDAAAAHARRVRSGAARALDGVDRGRHRRVVGTDRHPRCAQRRGAARRLNRRKHRARRAAWRCRRATRKMRHALSGRPSSPVDRSPRRRRWRVPRDAVTIYRCTDAAGHLTLRDTPCAQGREAADAQHAAAEGCDRRRRVRAAPRCATRTVRARRRTADRHACARRARCTNACTPDGEPLHQRQRRRQPALGAVVDAGLSDGAGRCARTPIAGAGWRITNGGVHIDGSAPSLRPPVAIAVRAVRRRHLDPRRLPRIAAAGSVRAPGSIAATRSGTRFFNAMPSERDALRVEERGINARLDNDCGGG